jgi:hypothetical protein
MGPYYFEPRTGSALFILCVFVASLIIFHFILIRLLNLGAIAWKRVEYCSLVIFALGLLSAVSQVRTLSAADQIGLFQKKADASLSLLRELAQQRSSRNGYLCRPRTRAVNSPPPEVFNRAQRDYSQACDWFKDRIADIPPQVPTPPVPLSLPPRPDFSAYSWESLDSIFNDFDSQLTVYNNDIRALGVIYQRAHPTNLDDDLTNLWPFLLAIALALQITQVTGEIGLES